MSRVSCHVSRVQVTPLLLVVTGVLVLVGGSLGYTAAATRATALLSLVSSIT